ncbi:hypothetical protein [Acinetobacter sp. F-1]|uniref:hypothetical protein n=1 Tax=Acinetobacter sp. F-1 TaxID=1796981 RepID=UPI001FD00926|nr:hypothetical protein [Acinetobacter sp. F-1]
MLRLLAVTTLGLGMMMSGCTTTQQVIAKVQSSSDTPLEQVLQLRTDLRKELATVELRQFFDKVESPTIGQVKVTETGLMDDSVHSVQTIYYFKREDNSWMLQNTEKLYRCARGSNTKTFQKAVCP